MIRRFSLLPYRCAGFCFMALAVACPAQAFDVNEGEIPAARTGAAASTVRPPMVGGYRGYSSGPFSPPPIAFSPLSASPERGAAVAAPQPLQAAAPVVYPPIQFAPLASAPAAAPAVVAAPAAAAAPVVYPPIQFAPLSSPAASAAAPVSGAFDPLAKGVAPVQSASAPRVAFPPVDPAVAARAQAQLQAVGKPEPLAAAAPEALSRSTKSILGTIPSKLDTPVVPKTEKVKLSRTSPALEALDLKAGGKKVDAYEAAGIKISVRRPGLDTNYELNRAYTALSGGDSATAMKIYKDILSVEPVNQDALFGLASLYHRQGDIARARPLYGVLLKNYPNHREGINNFLVLVSDEAPQEALAELERLEQRNPDFSPIPAQQALVLEKLGYAGAAQAKMMRALELAPENLAYKYNLAVMMDRQANYAEAAALYRALIDSAAKGAVVPASVDAIQRRLNYISTLVQLRP